MTNTSWTERCLGTVVLPLHGEHTEAYGANLICPTGYVRRNGQCVEVEEDQCPLPATSPVDAMTGRASGSVLDWRSSGETNALELMRSYSSKASGYATPVESRLGNAWRTGFDAVAVWEGELSKARLIHAVLPDGFEYSFALKRGVWTLVRPRLIQSGLVWDQPRTGVNVGVTVSGGTVEVNLPDGTRYLFDGQGQLMRITFVDGYTQTLTYTGDLNTRVFDSLGRWMEFTYGGADAPPGQPSSLLTKVRTDDGKVFLFTYEDRAGAGDSSYSANSSSTNRWVLKSVTYPDGTPAVATDNPMSIYEYHPSSVRPFLLTGVSDRDGVKSSTWTYDSKGRATASTHADGAERWAYAYDDVSKTVTITDPEGRVTVDSRLRGVDGSRPQLQTPSGQSYIENGFVRNVGSGRCLLGFFCFGEPPPPVCMGPSEDHALEECRKAADGSDDDWRAFCKSSKWFVRFDDRRPARCFEESFKSPVSKKNWCYNEFGD